MVYVPLHVCIHPLSQTGHNISMIYCTKVHDMFTRCRGYIQGLCMCSFCDHPNRCEIPVKTIKAFHATLPCQISPSSASAYRLHNHAVAQQGIGSRHRSLSIIVKLVNYAFFWPQRGAVFTELGEIWRGVVCTGADSTGQGKFAPVLVKEPEQTAHFAPLFLGLDARLIQ